MATINELLSQLQTDKNNLVENLVAKGVEASTSETFTSLVPKVLAIFTGVDTSDATATAEDIAIGKTAYVNDEKLIGTLKQNVEFVEEADFTGADSTTQSGFLRSIKKINIPNGTTTIGDYAFYYISYPTIITIPYSVTSIGTSAFCGCKGLESMNIPDSVTSIGDVAFHSCTNLKSITIPDCVTSIGNSVFYGCTSLESIIIPKSVTSIGYQAFYSCTSLKSIIIPKSVTSIGHAALAYCKSGLDIYYTGTSSQWDAITKGTNWSTNTAPTIHYNYVPE